MEGGNKLEALLKKAQTANDLPSVEVGILPGTQFTGGQPVAPVAHKAEYGAPSSKRGPGQPPRPALRNATEQVVEIVREENDGIRENDLPENILHRIGRRAAAAMSESIIKLRSPGLAGKTIAARKREGQDDNPLVARANYETRPTTRSSARRPPSERRCRRGSVAAVCTVSRLTCSSSAPALATSTGSGSTATPPPPATHAPPSQRRRVTSTWMPPAAPSSTINGSSSCRASTSSQRVSMRLLIA